MTEDHNHSLARFKKILTDWSDVIKLDAEQEFAKSTFIAILKSVEASDNFLSWTLGLVGVTMALIVGSLDTVTATIGAEPTKCALRLFMYSGLFGFASKICSHYAMVGYLVMKELNDLLRGPLEAYYNEHEKIENMAQDYVEPPSSELNDPKVLAQISEPFNWFEKKSIKSSFEKGKKDHLYVYKRGVRFTRWHGYFMVFHVILLAWGFYELSASLIR